VAFKGWPEEAIEFYEGLEADNSKTYWNERKHIFEECVKAPMQAIVDELGGGKLFRPYRDIRFSKDKSPYKTWMAATLDVGGYISLSRDGLSVGTGYYEMAPDQLERYRAAVDDKTTGTKLTKLASAMRAKDIEVGGHEVLKTAPRGYPNDHPRIEFLRYKGITAWRQWAPAAWLSTAKAKERVVTFLKDAKPLNAWLDANVGPSQAAARHR
jgi:uncharacterized protein (TIGR02453 family)